MYTYGSPHMAAQKQDDQLERTFSSYVMIQDVVLKTYLGRWTIGRSGERGSGISVLPARYDDDDDVGLTTITLLRRLTMHLSVSSSIVLHLKNHSIRKSKFWKVLLKNTTIIALCVYVCILVCVYVNEYEKERETERERERLCMYICMYVCLCNILTQPSIKEQLHPVEDIRV